MRAVASLAGLFERIGGSTDASGSDCLRRSPQFVGRHRKRREIAGVRGGADLACRSSCRYLPTWSY
jgi:hypothetical protein